jgi:hypothetical protein
VRGEAWNDVGGAGTWWQQGNVNGACVCRMHSFAFKEMDNDGFGGRNNVGCRRVGH